jgi:hypothetical protein
MDERELTGEEADDENGREDDDDEGEDSGEVDEDE